MKLNKNDCVDYRIVHVSTYLHSTTFAEFVSIYRSCVHEGCMLRSTHPVIIATASWLTSGQRILGKGRLACRAVIIIIIIIIIITKFV